MKKELDLNLSFDDEPVISKQQTKPKKEQTIIDPNQVQFTQVKELATKQAKMKNKVYRQFYLTQSLLNQLDSFCEINNYSKTDVVELAIREFLERNKK